MQMDHEVTPETNGGPEALVEEATELLVVESGPEWSVSIEHIGCDTLIKIGYSSHNEAIALLDQIELALAGGENRIRPHTGHLISLERLRQAWIDETGGRMPTATDPS